MLMHEMMKEEDSPMTEICRKYKLAYSSAIVWKREKYIPMRKQVDIERLSKGRYKAALMHAEKWLRNWSKKNL